MPTKARWMACWRAGFRDVRNICCMVEIRQEALRHSRKILIYYPRKGLKEDAQRAKTNPIQRYTFYEKKYEIDALPSGRTLLPGDE